MAESKDVETFAFQAEVCPVALLTRGRLLGLCSARSRQSFAADSKVLSLGWCVAQINQLLSLIINTVRCLALHAFQMQQLCCLTDERVKICL